MLPYIKQYSIDSIIEQSHYTVTKQISKVSSILSFVALKALNARRYTAEDAWCMDRGLGLFAGLNVLPKAAWFSSYSHRVKFVIIRRRGKNIIENLESVPKNQWKKVRVERAGNKKVALKVLDQTIFLKGYDKNIRQISITGHGRIKPATILVNDFELPVEKVVRKYARRWIVEKSICEQIDFFHLNSASSSMVIKVDFDLSMSILTHNLFRLFALDT